MANIIPERDRIHRTWDEICRDFPKCYVAILNPDVKDVSCTGGTVLAYTPSGNALDASEVGIFAVRNKCVFTTTLDESEVCTLW